MLSDPGRESTCAATGTRGRQQLRVRNRMRASFQEHIGSIEAIAAGDSERAAAMLRDHVVVQGERFTDLVATLRQLNAHDKHAGTAAPCR